jgi:hypothetical protein
MLGDNGTPTPSLTGLTQEAWRSGHGADKGIYNFTLLGYLLVHVHINLIMQTISRYSHWNFRWLLGITI